MKFTALILSFAIASANAKTRRHLNTIKGDESDASMSYMLSPERGGSSKSKSATGAPTGSPTGSRKFHLIHVVVHIMCSKPILLFSHIS